MDIRNLTKEEREELKAQLEAEEKAEKARVENEREEYKRLVDASVRSAVGKLQKLSDEMMRVKREVFEEFDTLIRMKNELFRVKLDRKMEAKQYLLSLQQNYQADDDIAGMIESRLEKLKSVK